LTVLTIFCSLVLAFYYWTLGTAIRPLQNLTEAFSRVGNGDYRQHVSEKGPLELLHLCQGFNRMVQRLARAEDKNHRLQKQLLTVQEEERADLARDLHDEVGPLLFAVDVDAVAIEQLIDKNQTAITERVTIIREAVGQMQKHVRGILGRLRPAVLLDVGLAHAIDNLVAFWRAHNRKLSFALDVPEEGFGEIVDAAVYRIVQESVSNAVRHATPSTIEIEIKPPRDEDEIIVCVKDDGGGLKPGTKSGSFGILGMRERVESLGGTLNVVDRGDCHGVVVTARIPLSFDDDAPRLSRPRQSHNGNTVMVS
jgi:two-component system sensor histidine kinase UhpB